MLSARRKKVALTKGEIVQVCGRLVVRVGEALDDPSTPGTITKAEALALIQPTLTDLLSEFAD